MAKTGPNTRWPDPRRLADQIRLILEALPNVGVDPPNWRPSSREFPKYLFQEGVILVRDEDLDRVRALVPGETRDGLVRGVTLYAPSRRSTLDALNVIEESLGIGVATPDHVLSVCPRSLCPATEPEETGDTTPSPVAPSEPGCDGDGVLVSVVDTGWLRGAETLPWLETGVDGDAEGDFQQVGTIGPYVGHGTFIAGVVRSMAPRCEVFVERIDHHAGAWFESQMITQLNEALARGADIISLSAGTSTRNDHALVSFEAWYETSLRHRKDVVFVAAAGNDGSRQPFWPAAFDWAISVGATDLGGTRRPLFSNFGPWVNVSAPGEGLVNAFGVGDYVCNEGGLKGKPRTFTGLARWSGTSFAAPMVAGMIAARMSGTGRKAPEAADELMRSACANSQPGIGPVLVPGMACDASPCRCGCGRSIQP